MAAGPASAQRRAELEVEHDAGATISRFELLDGSFYLLRAEREQEDGVEVHRVGAQIPGRLLGLDGYASLFLEDGPDGTGAGANFELGRGVPLLGGSLERGTDAFTGLYLRLRGGDVDVAFGGGRRNRDWIGHWGVYAKSTRFSAAVGGASGAGGVDFQHLSGTWHPAERGAAPGAMFAAERRSAHDWFAEVFVADRANFNHYGSWGAYGMDQWPHEKTFEAVGDLMRYHRPPTPNHERTAGLGILGGRYRVRAGEAEVTLDGRFYPVRLFHRPPAAPAPRRWLADRVIPSFMIGAIENLHTGASTVLGQIALPPFVLYGETTLDGVGEPYLLLQYGVGLPF